MFSKKAAWIVFCTALALFWGGIGCENAKTGGDVRFESGGRVESAAPRGEMEQQAAGRAENSGRFDYHRAVLDNGLEVITMEDFSCPIVTVQVWYHVGSRHEDPARQGFAHMFEHMMFKGTDLVGEKDHFGLINQVGGSNNGYTSFDKTVYLQTVPENQVELAMWLEAERMNFLDISPGNFQTERNVVLEELRMRANEPYGTMYKKVAQELFQKHPYRWMPIGELEHLQASRIEELRSFWEKYYVPNNATLIVVGAIENEKAVSMAEQYFGWIPREEEVEHPQILEPMLEGPGRVVIEDENAPAGLSGIVWRTVARGHRDEVVLDMLSEILGGGKSSRLYRNLVNNQRLAVKAMATTFNLEDDGIFVAGGALMPGSENYESILSEVLEEVERIQSRGVRDDEFEKAKNQMLRRLVTESLTIDEKARMLGDAAVVQGDVSKVNTIFDRVRQVRPDDLQRAAKQYLKPDARFEVLVKENARGSASDSGDYEASEPPVETVTYQPGREGVTRPEDYPRTPPIHEAKGFASSFSYKPYQMDNGLRVIAVENHEVPFVTVRLGLQAGTWTEHKPGTAAMTMRMITRGTEQYTAVQLARELEQNAIELNGTAGMDTSEIHASFVTAQTDRAVGLLAEVTLRPTFPQEEFIKLKEETITELAIQSEEPRYLAQKYFNQAMYGEHPYARTVEGEPEDIETLSVQDLSLWARKWLRPDQATLIFAGDITREEAIRLAEKYFGAWQTNLVEVGLILPDIQPVTGRKIIIVDRPGSIQSQILLGKAGITRHDQPEYFISRVVSNYFGWSFNSRLNSEIRIRQGLTYFVYGGYTAKRRAGEFVVSTFTKTESTGQTVQAMLDEIENLKEAPPTDRELRDSRQYLTGSFIRNRETPSAVASDIWLIESHGLDRDYLSKLLDKIAQTDRRDCMELIEQTVDTENLVITIVGDAGKIRDQVSSLGPIEVIEPQLETALAQRGLFRAD